MSHFDSIKNMDINELLKTIEGKNRNNERADQVKYTIMVRCAEGLVNSFGEMKESIDKNAESSNALSKKLYWLNVVLALATIIIAGAAILDIYYKCPN